MLSLQESHKIYSENKKITDIERSDLEKQFPKQRRYQSLLMMAINDSDLSDLRDSFAKLDDDFKPKFLYTCQDTPLLRILFDNQNTDINFFSQFQKYSTLQYHLFNIKTKIYDLAFEANLPKPNLNLNIRITPLG